MRATNTIRNWDHSRSWNPEVIHHPGDEEEVAAVVRGAVERGHRVKPLGSALSWSDIIDVPQAAMRFDRLDDVIEVDREARRVTVQSGIGMRRLNQVLADHGLAFENFGSIVMQTIGGYVGTGTHGTGGRTRILSSQIERMRLVDGTGVVHELDADHESELFSAARVNLGCLGVVTELTLRCVDAFQLEERLELVDFDRALADLDTYVADNDFCKLWWIPYTDKIQVYRFNRTEHQRTRPTASELLDSSGLSGAAFTGLIRVSRRFPSVIPWVHKALQSIHFRPHVRVDRSDRITKVAQSIPVHQETEYAIPRQNAARAIDEVRQLVDRATSYRLNFPMEVRFVAADDIPLSPASGRDSCYIGGYIASPEWAPRYFADFEPLMHDFAGRPHWGKDFSRTDRELRALYPAYDQFAALRRTCDPHGVFRNQFVDRVFPALG